MTFHSKASQCHNSTTTFLRSLGKFIAAVFLHNDGDDDDAMSEFPTFLKNAQKTDREKLSALEKDFRDNLSSAPNTKNPQTFFFSKVLSLLVPRNKSEKEVLSLVMLSPVWEKITLTHTVERPSVPSSLEIAEKKPIVNVRVLSSRRLLLYTISSSFQSCFLGANSILMPGQLREEAG